MQLVGERMMRITVPDPILTYDVSTFVYIEIERVKATMCFIWHYVVLVTFLNQS